jgi:hypothetical protein
LGNAEFALNHPAEVPCGLLATNEQLEDAPADRVTENIECVHTSMLASTLI